MEPLDRILRLGVYVLAPILFYACQSVGPTGRAVERATEPEKTAEQLLAEELGPNSARKLVGTFGAEITLRNCKLTIPGGSLDSDTYVGVSLADNAPEGFIRETAYVISPETIRFKKPALLRLHYFDDDLAQNQNEENIFIVRETRGQWFPVSGGSLDVFNNILSVEIYQAGTYALRVSDSREPLVNIPPSAKLSFELITVEEKEAEESPKTEVQEEKEETVEEEPREGTPSPEGNAILEENATLEKLAPKSADETMDGEADAKEETLTPPRVESQNPDIKESTDEVPRIDDIEEVPREKLISPESDGKSSFEIEVKGRKEVMEAKGLTEFQVRYSAEGSQDPDGAITKYLWDFDADGVFDEIGGREIAEENYLDYGKVLTLLKVEDNHRPPAWDLAYATVQLPQNHTAPRLPIRASVLLFPKKVVLGGKLFAGVSVTGGTPPYKFSWEFSNGETSVEQALTLSPINRGKFTARVSVTDAEGATALGEASSEVVGEYKHPSKELRARIMPETVRLDAPGKVEFSVLAEGAFPPMKLRIASTDGRHFITEKTSFSFTFENSGYDVLSVALTDSFGQSAKLFVPVRIGGFEEGFTGLEPFGLAPDISAEIVNDGQTVKLSAVRIPKGAVVTWDLGDGTTKSGVVITKKYAKAGVYTVKLIVDDGIQRLTRTMPVPAGGGKLTAGINLPSRIIATAPTLLTPRATVSGGKYPLFYRWKLGDLFSDDEFPRFIVDTPGKYQLQLTVVDADGNSFDADPVAVEVYKKAPDYRYPVAFVTSSATQETEESELRLVEFDGASVYHVPLTFSPLKVYLAPGGENIAVIGEDGFSLLHIPSLRVPLTYTPSTGKVEKVFPVRPSERVFFNLRLSEGDLMPRGYVYRRDTGFVPLGREGEKVLDVSPDGDKALLMDAQGNARVLAIDEFSGTISEVAKVPFSIYEGRLTTKGANEVFILSTGEVVLYDFQAGRQKQVSGTEAKKSNLQASIDASTIAWQLEGGEIVVWQALEESENNGFPVNISELNGFTSDNWQLSPDGKLLAGYGKVEDRAGLYLIELTKDLKSASLEDLAPNFLAETTGEFSISSSLKPFDVLTQETGK